MSDIDNLRVFQATVALRSPMCSSDCCWLGLRCLGLSGLGSTAERPARGVDGWRSAHLLRSIIHSLIIMLVFSTTRVQAWHQHTAAGIAPA